LTRLIRAEQREALDTAIDLLPRKYRLPLVLRYFSELDYGAIAEVLGVRRNQVGTLLFRAKRRLREQLGQGESS
jgi:RNA polymerase sigma factor (sigma-70 family)